jgi:pilus assembly protein CpaB
MLELQEIPRRFVHDSYFFNLSDLAIGYVTIADVEQGQIIQRNMVDANAGLEPGYRAVAVATDQVASVGANVRPGNRVDVLVSYDDGQQTQTIILLEDIEVLAVNSLLPSGGSDLPGGASPNRFLPTGQMIKDSVVTLALVPEDAARLTYMSNFGAEVRLMIRRLDEAESRPVEPVTQDDFQTP